MILVDGVASASVPADDRGFSYGDGVFRTLHIRARRPRLWKLHYAKLASDCARLRIPCPSEALLADEILSVARADPDCVLKIVVSRGSGARGYRYAASTPRRVLISADLPQYPHEYRQEGVRVRQCTLRLAQQPALAGVKHLNRLENVLARAEWDDPRIAEGLLLDSDAHVIGGTMTNLFIATQGTLVTPRLDRCGVAGVTRDRIMHAAALNGVGCRVADIRWNDVLDADEVMLVNSLAGVWPVREIDAMTVRTGSLVRHVQSWLEQNDAQDR